MDHNFVWNNHFQYVSKKISSYLWLLSQIRSYLTEQHRLLYYNAYIKPHLEYCCIVWGNSSNFNTYKIEKLQTRACKLILGKDYTTLEDARNYLHVLSFEETIFIHKAKTMYKIATNSAPIYLSELFQIRDSGSNPNLFYFYFIYTIFYEGNALSYISHSTSRPSLKHIYMYIHMN